MRKFGGLIFLSLVVALATSPVIGAEDEYIAAFEKDAGVSAKIKSMTAQGFEPKQRPHRIIVEGVCGVAGCSYSALVIQVLGTSGVNPQTSHVAATVSKMFGQTKVQIVRFAPADDQ